MIFGRLFFGACWRGARYGIVGVVFAFLVFGFLFAFVGFGC